MKSRTITLLTITALMLIVGALTTATVFAARAAISSEPVLIFAVGPNPAIPGPGVIGPGSFTDIPGTSSQLVRNDNGVSISVHTSGLTPGAYTTWWIIDEDGVPPFEIVLNAGGKVVGSNGKAGFAAHLSVGAIPAADFVTILRNGDGTFDTPQTATIGLVIRYHGPAVPGLVAQQTHTFLGGCTNVGATGIAPSGTFVCFDPQITIHAP